MSYCTPSVYYIIIIIILLHYYYYVTIILLLLYYYYYYYYCYYYCYYYYIIFVVDNPVAVYNVGTHYFSGYGVAQNLEKAREYYERASALGFAPAQVSKH